MAGIVGPGSTAVAVNIAPLLGKWDITEFEYILFKWTSCSVEFIKLIIPGSLGYPLISYAATSNALSDTERFSLFARTMPSDAYQCSAIKDIIL